MNAVAEEGYDALWEAGAHYVQQRSSRTRQRGIVTDVVDPARVRATDVTAFLAEEMFAVGMRTSAGSPNTDRRYVAALAAEHRGALALDSLLQFSNAEALERFAQYRTASKRWHDPRRAATVERRSAVPWLRSDWPSRLSPSCSRFVPELSG